ncbi:MAG: hypothetical protein J1G38_02600 [Clostridiales bacterium]|nr:hypothetical protein [Clostridiales bacterium]
MANKRMKKRYKSNNDNHDLLGVVLIIVSVFLLLCIVIPPILSVVSEAIFSVVLGIFGIAAYPGLVALLTWGIMLVLRWKHDAPSVKNSVCIALLIFCAATIFQLASTHAFLDQNYTAYIADTYSVKYSFGGIVMGTIAFGLQHVITEAGCYILFSLLALIVFAVMIDAVGRIRAYAASRKAPVEKAEPAPSFDTRTDPQSVIPVDIGHGLFVGTIARKAPPQIFSETGRASQIAESEPRAVSDYAEDPVMLEPKISDKHSAAHMALYGDSDALKRKSAEEYRRSVEERREDRRDTRRETTAYSQPVREEYVEKQESELVEPYIRTAEDARANTSSGPRKIVHDTHDVFFPVEKHLVFNDDGIENADDIKRRLREDAKKRKWSDIETSESREPAPKIAEPKRTPPPVFMPIKRPEPVQEPVRDEPIIDADLDRRNAAPRIGAPAESKAQSAPTAESVDDRFLRAFGATSDMPKFEPEPVQDDIINTDIMRGTSFIIESEPERSDLDPDDIIVGDEPEENAEKPDSVVRPAPVVSVKEDNDIGIIDGMGGMKGLSIVDGPAVDLTERHDITSDLIDGEDLSGMYGAADDEQPAPPIKPARVKRSAMPIDNQISIQSMIDEKADESIVIQPQKRHKKYGNYLAPPIDLLKKYQKNDMLEEELNRNAAILEEVIGRFLKSEVKVVRIVPGPTVTRYELECQTGVPVKQIETHSSDIEYELASISKIRIEAPIPGKRAVGIEVPNANKSIVGIREIIESEEYVKAKSPMTFAVGKGISGDVVLCDLEKVPHLLIAGQTGSGKSACLNGLIVSLLYKSSPEDLRFILVDPKRVEFSAYAGMPHLLFNNIIYEPNEVLNALKWGVNEMERRYALLQKYRCNQLSAFNKHQDVISGKIDRLPHIIIIIDELADIMQSTVKRDIEDKIKTIAAKARAAGIHLIVATQRPSADVLTGTIKTNLTSRIAFKVSGQTDSRIILDVQGAEALVGQGDMLFFPVDYSSPKRVQGSFISDEEVASVLGHIKENVECDFDEDAMNAVFGSSDESFGAEAGMQKAKTDPLLPDVLALVIRTKQASTSSIQRRFSIGYARASRIIDIMEELKYIGPATGNSKPRDVFITNEQFREQFGYDADENN